MTHVDDLLAARLLGDGTDVALRAAVDDHLATCERCRELASALTEALHRLPDAVPPLDAADGTRARLLSSVDALERYTGHAPRVAALLGIGTHDARLALHRFSDQDGWHDGPFARMRWTPAPTGPGRSTAFAILARLQPGAEVPAHRHLGTEEMLVLEGTLVDQRGRVVGAGESLASTPGSEHRVHAGEGGDCCCVVVEDGGIDWRR